VRVSSWSLGDAVGRLVERGVLKVLDHPTVQAVVEQGQPVVAVLDAARECALRNVDDEAARAELQQRLPDDHEVVDRAVQVLADQRRNYRDDRAYRILHACLDDTAVQAIDLDFRDAFLAEARLGRRPLLEAFDELAALEPRLRDPQLRRVVAARRSGWGLCGSEILVGRWAADCHPVLSTDLAEDIVSTYQELAHDRPRLDAEPSTAFIERQPVPMEGFPRFLGAIDPRPRATD
jgi:hypothetical protein